MPFMQPRDVVTFVTSEMLYGIPSTEDNARNILATLDLQDTLILCGRLNAVVSGIGTVSIEDRIRHALSLLELPREERRIRKFAERLGEHAASFRLFFRGEFLELMRLALKHCPRDRLPDCYAFKFNRKQFLRAALIAGARWAERVRRPQHDADALSPENVGEHIGYLRKMAEDTNPAPSIASSIGRGWLLFSEILPKHYPPFKTEFLEATAMTFEQYFTCICGLTTYIAVGNESEGRVQNINTVGAATRYRGVFPHFMGLDSQTPEEMALASAGTQADFERAMWQRPIIRFADESSIIADPIFFSAKLSIGPLFVPLRGHPERGRALLGAFGDAFEEYANGILRRMFKAHHFNLKKVEGKTTVFEVDALVAEGPAAFVFETKAKFLNEDLVSGNAYAGFVAHLRDKYVSRGNAVWQLAKITRSMSAGDWATIPPEFQAATRIFPIVLTHDIRMDTPGTGMFLDQEMKRQNSGIPSEARIEPLIVLTIRDLELLEGSISSGRHSLTDLLSGYLSEQVEVDPLCSFYNYLVRSPFAGELQPSPVVLEKSREILQNAQDVLFPKGDEG